MDRFLIAFFAAALGAAAGTFGVLQWQSSRPAPEAPEARGTDELRQEIADLRRLLDRPAALAPAKADAARPGQAAGLSSASATGPADADASLSTLSKADLVAAVEHATEAALEKRAAKDKSERPDRAGKKRVSLTDASRELSLSASQEADIRRAYDDAAERFLKVMTEPDGDPLALRRELEGVRADPGKKQVLVAKYLPKFLTKFPDMMSIQAERDEKIRKTVGEETFQKLDHYQIEESDPFGLSGDVSVGVRAGN